MDIFRLRKSVTVLTAISSGLLIWEMKFPGGDTAESHAFQSMLRCQLQAGTVAGRQFLPLPAGNAALNNGADGMQDVPGREVVAPCQLGPAIGFRVALGLHDLIALVPKLEASRRMNGVVNADVAGTETAQQSGVVRIYNRVHLQPGNVPSPDGNSRMAR